MKIEQGLVKYKDRDDIVCTYEKTDDGRQYYFLNLPNDGKLKNGNRIVTNNLKEAIDFDIKPSNIGMIDENGNEVMTFDNRKILPINDDILLVEKPQPVTESVILASKRRSSGEFATELVSTAATIKNNLNAKMGVNARYIFNNQFSEATICDISGNNLINNEFYSFIGLSEADSKLFFSKNTVDSPIVEYSILPPNVQSNVTPKDDTSEINVEEINISKDVIDEAMKNENNELNNKETMLLDTQEEVPLTSDESVAEDVTEEAESFIEDNVQEEVPLTGDESIAEDVTEEVESIIDDSVQEEVPLTGDESIAEDVTEEVESIIEDNAQEEVPLESDESLVDDVDVNGGVELTTEDNIHEETLLNSDNSMVPDFSERSKGDDKQALEETKEDLDFSKDVEEENVFKDSIITTDSIVVDDPLNFSEEVVYESKGDTIITDVARSMNSLIKQNKAQRDQINEMQEKLDKLSVSRRNIADKAKVQEQRLELATAKLRNTSEQLAKYEAKNQMLEEKIAEQEKIIAEQAHDIEQMKPQLAGKENLVQLLADAQVLLGQDDYSNTNEGYFGKAA